MFSGNNFFHHSFSISILWRWFSHENFHNSLSREIVWLRSFILAPISLLHLIIAVSLLVVKKKMMINRSKFDIFPRAQSTSCSNFHNLSPVWVNVFAASWCTSLSFCSLFQLSCFSAEFSLSQVCGRKRFPSLLLFVYLHSSAPPTLMLLFASLLSDIKNSPTVFHHRSVKGRKEEMKCKFSITQRHISTFHNRAKAPFSRPLRALLLTLNNVAIDPLTHSLSCSPSSPRGVLGGKYNEN